MAPHPISLLCALALPPPSHRDATTPSPCWGPHFTTQERIMFSNPTPSKPRLFLAATISDDMLSTLTSPFLSEKQETGGKGNDTGSKIGFPCFSKSETIETNWGRDGTRLKSDNLRRGCRLQDRGAVQVCN